jgi:hypothetical protein
MMEPGETLQRLMSIRQPDAFAHRGSRVALMREYLRRSAWWAQAVNATDEWPFFDIAARIDPAVRASSYLADRLDDFIESAVHAPVVASTCRAALHWSALVTTPGTQVPNLPDPFEPLLAMYERGGSFTATANGFIDVGSASIMCRSWRDHLATEQLASLDDRSLDQLDSETESEPSGRHRAS